MQTIHVNVSDPYDVMIGRGLIGSAGIKLKAAVPGAEKTLIVTDDRVGPLYARKIKESLESAGIEAFIAEIPHGEQHKTAEYYLYLLNEMAGRQLTRTDAVVALGGGVTGDMTGFAAATFLRGIRFIQIPTSLLAMVDSSVGGKTAIDLPAGKNLAGAFCQPAAVICDPDVLDTLPEEELTGGMAEVLKAGILRMPALFEHLTDRGLLFDREYTIASCVAMKRDYVEVDEFDTGIRRELNLGHTVGHALEKCSGYSLSHGRAVSIGMSVISGASAAAGICSEECARKIAAGLRRFGLPVSMAFQREQILGYMLSDKKRRGSRLTLIVPESIGSCRTLDLPLEEVPQFLEPGFCFAEETGRGEET